MKYTPFFLAAFLAWYGLVAFIVYDWNWMVAAREWDGVDRTVALFSFLFPALICLMYVGHKGGWECD